jgi:hypothetical protein
MTLVTIDLKLLFGYVLLECADVCYGTMIFNNGKQMTASGGIGSRTAKVLCRAIKHWIW